MFFEEIPRVLYGKQGLGTGEFEQGHMFQKLKTAPGKVAEFSQVLDNPAAVGGSKQKFAEPGYSGAVPDAQIPPFQ